MLPRRPSTLLLPSEFRVVPWRGQGSLRGEVLEMFPVVLILHCEGAMRLVLMPPNKCSLLKLVVSLAGAGDRPTSPKAGGGVHTSFGTGVRGPRVTRGRAGTDVWGYVLEVRALWSQVGSNLGSNPGSRPPS